MFLYFFYNRRGRLAQINWTCNATMAGGELGGEATLKGDKATFYFGTQQDSPGGFLFVF